MNPYDDEDTVDELPAPPRKDIPAADRELLELAARAIGAEFEEVDGEGYGNLHFPDGSVVHAWNPLQFYGDTFELAVKLGFMEIAFFPSGIEPGVTVNDEGICCHEKYGSNAAAATARAITRAAAELGKQRS